MFAHLTSQHNEVLIKLQSPADQKKQPTMTEFTSVLVTKPLAKDGKIYKDLTKLLGEIFVENLLPLSFADSKSFRNFTKGLNPRYPVPCRQTVANVIIPSMYNKTKVKLMAELNSVKALGLTTDCWTSRATKSFITVTVHYIKDWELKSAVLTTNNLPDSHTAEHLAESLQTTFEDWHLVNKAVTGNCDNARNILKAFVILELLTIGCMGHILNLAANKVLSLNSVANVVGRCKRLVSHFHFSALASQKLEEKQKLLGVPVRKLIQSVETRWNSTFDMIQSVLKQQLAISAVLMEGGNKLKQFSLETKDVELLEVLSEVLQPLKDVTVKISGQSYSTVTIIAPTMHMLMKKHYVATDGDSKFRKDIKAAICTNLESRYQKPKVKLFINSAAVVDPRFRHLSFLNVEDKEAAYNAVKEEMCRSIEGREAPQNIGNELSDLIKQEPTTSISQSSNDIPSLPILPQPSLLSQVSQPQSSSPSSPVAAKRVKLTFDFDDIIFVDQTDPETPIQRATREFERYLVEPVDPEKLRSMSFDPLTWWKLNNRSFPLLAKIATNMLCVPATSTPSERVFSTAGNILTQKRSSLKCEIVDKLIFLHMNYFQFENSPFVTA